MLTLLTFQFSAMSSRIIERIFSGTVLRGWDVANPLMAAHDKMTYSDFVWFLLSEEDKKTPTAIGMLFIYMLNHLSLVLFMSK